MAAKYGIKYFYDITDRSDFRANPDYKGVCHIAMAQEGHCKPGAQTPTQTLACTLSARFSPSTRALDITLTDPPTLTPTITLITQILSSPLPLPKPQP